MTMRGGEMDSLKRHRQVCVTVCEAMVTFKGKQLCWPNPLSASSPDVFFILRLDWASEHLVSSLSSAVYYHVISLLKPPISSYSKSLPFRVLLVEN